MPVEITEFEKSGEEVSSREGTWKQRVLDYIEEQKCAFTQGQIAEVFDLSSSHAHNTLMGLVEDGNLVRGRVEDPESGKYMIHYAVREDLDDPEKFEEEELEE